MSRRPGNALRADRRPLVQVGSVAALDADVDAFFGFAAGYEVHDRRVFRSALFLIFSSSTRSSYTWISITSRASRYCSADSEFSRTAACRRLGAFDDFPHHGDLSVFDFHAGHPQHQLHTRRRAALVSLRRGKSACRRAAPISGRSPCTTAASNLVIGCSERHRIHPRAFRLDPYPLEKSR